ncbi:MAG: hypothetical protein ACOX5R_06420 [bacterium]|jgi:hypothetical protein
MNERTRFEHEFADLGIREFQIASPAAPATLGFEFDVHYGLLRSVVTDAGKSMPSDGDQITSHSSSTDGFKVKLDGPRLEIATKPFTVDAAGKKELDDAIKKIITFSNELSNGCKNAAQKDIPIAGVQGKPRPFTHSKTLISGLPIVRLPFAGKFDPKVCSVWASPQATLTIPLSKVEALISEIKKTQGKAPGIALTGSSQHRMGLRSDAVYNAVSAVNKSWNSIVNQRPKLTLSDGTEVNRTTFTPNLKGFLILLASYLWTSELRYHFADPKPRDYEPFAKAYLPINVKAPFSAIFKDLLTAGEQLLFREIYATGSARVRFFQLAKRNATLADGSTKLFPPGRKELGRDSIHERQRLEFGTVPTWDDLLAHTLNPAHKGWGDRLMVPLSNIISLSHTKPRVPLELRRIGFNAVFNHQWKNLMNNIFKLTKKLNA